VICASCGARIRADRERCLRCHEPLVAWKRSEIPLPSWIHALGGGTLIFGIVAVFAIGVLAYLSFDSGRTQTNSLPQRPSQQKSASNRSAASPAQSDTIRIEPVDFINTPQRESAELAEADVEGARTRLEEALLRDPKDAETQNNLGLVLERLGFVSSAITHLSAAVALNRPNWAYHFNLAHAASLQQDWNRAASEYAAAVELFPANFPAQYNMAVALHRGANESAAINAFEKAIELAPGDPAPHLSLAVSLEAAGRADDAAAQYRTYLQMVPDARDASAVKARIEVLTHNS